MIIQAELAIFSTSLRIQDSAILAKAYNCIEGEGGKLHRKMYSRGGGHCTYFLNRETSKIDHMLILGWGHHTKFQTLALSRVSRI